MSAARRQRPQSFRLLCSQDTVTAVEGALPTQIGATGRMVSKTELVDAIVAVALAHPEEITARLTASLTARPTPEDSPDE